MSDVRLIITNSSQSEQLSEKGQELQNIFDTIYSSVKGKVPNVDIQKETNKHVVSKCIYIYERKNLIGLYF